MKLPLQHKVAVKRLHNQKAWSNSSLMQ
jgi:hypothetical protein